MDPVDVKTKAVEAMSEETSEEVVAPAEAEKKVTAKKDATPRKTAAKKAEATEAVYVQFAGAETEVAVLLDAAKAAFKAEKPRTAIKDLKLYVKPEEAAAYYVINGDFTGKVNF